MKRKKLINGSILLTLALIATAAFGWSSSAGRPERFLAGESAGPAAPARDLARARNSSAVGISGIVSLSVAAGEAAVQGGLAGVTLIGLPGDPVTDTSGAYAASVGQGWSGNVTPTKAGYSFSPAYRIYQNVTAAQANQDYIAAANLTISGSIKTAGGLGIGGVAIAFSNGGGTATTSLGGDYSIQVVSGWTGTAAPSKTGYSFLPQSRSYASITTDQSEQNYIAASSSFTISGVVLLSSPAGELTAQGGLAGVTLKGLPGNPATDSMGAYASLVDEGWSGNVTPEKTGYTFLPAGRGYQKVTSSQTAQDYTATLKTFVISGSVTTSGGTGLEDVEIVFSNDVAPATTDADGFYTRTVSYGWSGTGTPSKAGYTFSPVSRTYANIKAAQISHNYLATPIVPVISGFTKTSGGAGIEGVLLTFSNGGGTATTDAAGAYSRTVSYGWTGTATPSKTDFVFTPADRAYTNVTADHTGQDFTGASALPPQIALSKTKLNFGAQSGGVMTAPQSVIVNNAGGGTLNWTALPQYPWMTATPSAGTGTGTLEIGVNPAGLSEGTYPGNVYITASGATNSPQIIAVNLRVYGGTNSPFGLIETPADGTAGIEGSVPVTGWVVDDIGVESVKIYLDPDIYIGDAVFVEGARPDVEQVYSTYPLNSRAGWGYMMLTNFLPNSGNGMFRIQAIATDREGRTTLLGSRTIICDNAHATLPFGAIDLPSQGGTASGSTYINYAWVLTPMPKMIPTDGSTITAWVDGLPLGHPSYGFYRVDIATLFPGYANANGAIGFIPIDTTKYANGVHTIVWSATDSAGVNNGFGSRFFTIQNAGASAALSANDEKSSPTPLSQRGERGDFQSCPKVSIEDQTRLEPGVLRPVYVRKGFDLEAVREAVCPDLDGVIRVEIPIAGRVEITFDSGSILTGKIEGFPAYPVVRENPPSPPFEEGGSGGISPAGERERLESESRNLKARYSAYQVVGDEPRPLPIGSSFDAERGILTWQPGPGFLGEYRIVLADLVSDRKYDIRLIIDP